MAVNINFFVDVPFALCYAAINIMRCLSLSAVGVVLLSAIGVAEQQQATTTNAAAAPMVACPPAPEIRLAGTTLSHDTTASQALIEDVESGQQYLLNLNDSFEGYRLSSISPDGAVLSGDHCAGELSLTLTEGRLRKKADDLSHAVQFNPADSTHLVSVLPDSVLDRLGLKAGDTLVAVNGHNVKDSAAARAELSRLVTETLDSVSVQRDGRLTVFVNPESTAVRNFKPPNPSPQQSAAEGASTLAVGTALPSEAEER